MTKSLQKERENERAELEGWREGEEEGRGVELDCCLDILCIVYIVHPGCVLSSGYTAIGYIITWIYYPLDILSPGYIIPWIYCPLDILSPGYIIPWIYYPLDILSPGYIVLWIYTPLEYIFTWKLTPGSYIIPWISLDIHSPWNILSLRYPWIYIPLEYICHCILSHGHLSLIQ